VADQYLKIDGLNVRYVDTKDGRPVLLLHGLGGSIESWSNNISELSQDLRVITLDLPGFGFSDKPKFDYTIKFYVQFVARHQ
jgi:2-hydroxy-6-oxonona-2,4-dienedioate hydrolase